MTQPSAPRPGHEIQTGAPDAPAVSLVLAPQQSVLALLLQAASAQSWGAPAGLLPSVRDALRPHARFAAQSFTTPGWTPIPEACAPISPIADASVAEQAARIRDLPATALTRELEAGDNGDRHWPASIYSSALTATPADRFRIGLGRYHPEEGLQAWGDWLEKRR